MEVNDFGISRVLLKQFQFPTHSICGWKIKFIIYNAITPSNFILNGTNFINIVVVLNLLKFKVSEKINL